MLELSTEKISQRPAELQKGVQHGSKAGCDQQQQAAPHQQHQQQQYQQQNYQL